MRPRFYGSELAPGTVGARQVPQLPAAKTAQPPIPIRRWIRNGKHPNAWLASALNEAANQGAMFRTKESFSALGTIREANLPSSSIATRTRWRWAFHTGPYTHQLMAVAVMHPPDAGFGNDTYSTLEILTMANAAVSSAEFHYGPSPTGTTVASGWEHLKVITKYLEVDPDTDYHGVFRDLNYGRLQSVCVFEIPSMTTHYDGYLAQNIVDKTPILDVYREKVSVVSSALWKRGAAHVLNFSVDDQASPATLTSTTATNVLDASSTTYGASIPGFTLDMTGKDRLRETLTTPAGVPCKIKAYLNSTSDNNGQLRLADSAGATVANVNYSGAAGNPGWFSADAVLSANASKYYLMMLQTVGAATIDVHAVSIFEYQ